MRQRHLFFLGLFSLLLCVLLLWQRHGERSSPPRPSTSQLSAPETAAARSAAGRAHWELGQRRSYALSASRTLKIRSTAPGSSEPATAAEDSFRMKLAGEWNVTVVRADAFVVLAEVQLARPQIELGTDSDAGRRLGEALATPFFLSMEPSGRLRALRLPRRFGPLVRGFLKSVAATLQYVRGAGATWTSEEIDGTGEYQARYQLGADQRSCEKRRLRYTRVASAQGLFPMASMGRLSGDFMIRYTLSTGIDEAARVEGLEGQETLAIDPGPGMPQVSSWSAVSLRLLETAAVADSAVRAALADSPDYELAALGQLDVDPDGARRADEQRVRGASFAELLAQLSALLPGDGAQRSELLNRTAALLRLDAQAARQAQAAITSGTTDATARTLLGALGSADNAPAQAALADLAQNPRLSTALRENAVAMLGLADHPEDATAVALSKLHADADADVRATAALALGNVAQAQRQRGQVGESEQAVEELLAKLQAARTQDEQLLYIQALGNAGDARALPALQAALASPAIEVRSAAVTALRFIADDSVDALIASTLLRDSAVEVRRAAVFAGSFRSLLLLLPALRQAVLRDSAAAVRGDIVGVLGRSLTQPGIAELLRTIAAHDPSAEVQRAAAALLLQ